MRYDWALKYSVIGISLRYMNDTYRLYWVTTSWNHEKKHVYKIAFDDFSKICIFDDCNIYYSNQTRCLVVRCLLSGGPLTGG